MERMKKYRRTLSGLKLTDLLRRRKSDLDEFITQSGVQTYEALVILCNKTGVIAPTIDEWLEARPGPVTSQQDGCLVLEPIRYIDEKSGDDIPEELPVKRSKRQSKRTQTPSDPGTT